MIAKERAMLYKIYDYEINTTTVVEAPGILDEMLEYLPWPTVQLIIDYKPHHGRAKVEDKVTMFLYDVQAF